MERNENENIGMGSRNRDRMIPNPLRLDDVLRLDGCLIGFCDECMRSKVLPLQPLLSKFGREKIVREIAPALTCKMCGGKGVRIEAKFSR